MRRKIPETRHRPKRNQYGMISHSGKNNSIGSTSKNSGSAPKTGPMSLDAQSRGPDGTGAQTRPPNVACEIWGERRLALLGLCRTSRGAPRSAPSDDMRQSPQSVVCLPGSWEYRSDVRIKRHDNAALRVPRSVLVRPSPAEVVLGKEFVDCDVSGGLLSFCSLHTPSAQGASPSAR